MQSSFVRRGVPALLQRIGHLSNVVGARGFSIPADNFSGESVAFIEQLHARWQENPGSVDRSWQLYFESGEVPPPNADGAAIKGSPQASGAHPDLHAVMLLIRAYQVRGHEKANLDPLKLQTKTKIRELDPSDYEFTEADMDRPLNLHRGFGRGNISGLCELADKEGNGDGIITLREVIAFMERVYCGNIGFEYMHILERSKCNWIRKRIEVLEEPMAREEKLHILARLAFAHEFEEFLAVKFPTAKRFGLEGCESMIPGMKTLIDRSTSLGVDNIVVGMAHRGRLNVMVNVIRKPMEKVFSEFVGPSDEQDLDEVFGSGDVKYHMGTSFDRVYPDGRKVHISLLPNPSHLEAVNPLVVGKAAAKAFYLGDKTGSKVMPIILHGDAAVAGQGVVYEQIQMSRLPEYKSGGCIHIVCNNQIGYTTDVQHGRSTRYASDIAKSFDCPIFHVNADDPIAVQRVFQLAAEWRQEFHEDVWVDLIGYRLRGHNEMDQPRFTQPQMYSEVDKHERCLPLYIKRLLSEGITQAEVDLRVQEAKDRIEAAYVASQAASKNPVPEWLAGNWASMVAPDDKVPAPITSVSQEELTHVSKALQRLPEGFSLHPLVKRTLQARNKSLEDGLELDWGTAEALAFGTLVRQGVHVRLSGEDVERGTFSHRHAKLHDQSTGAKYMPLNNIPGAKAEVVVTNSPLSEFGAMGFELGYSMENPNALVLWEAQFGDFVNGAQIIIDQFLCAGESKWSRQNGLVLLLPHGYDGAGPEHSSCRLERFLQSCDEDPDVVPEDGVESQTQASNWQIVNCSTPANYFHLLRRQVLRQFRKPLIIAAPKALLRLRAASSSSKEFTSGEFVRVIGEVGNSVLPDDKIRRIVLCSGKIYYELAAQREKDGVNDVVLVRLEQIAPFPFHEVAATVVKYPNAEVVWCQEEPKNMGCWYYVQDRIMTATRKINNDERRPAYVGRPTMSSPAEGWGKIAAKVQANIVIRALSTEHDAFFGHGAPKN